MLELRGITKRFPGVLANDRVNLRIEQGVIRGLLGENGAGKSTLMNILYGMYSPDEGSILVDGNPVRIPSPREARRLGIGMVHQQFMLVPTLTVVENVVLGLPGEKGPLLNLKAAAGRLTELSKRYGLEVDPHARTGQLSVGMQQRVEIIKALFRGARLLILDEPSSVLTPGETRLLFDVLRKLKSDGCSVVFISHKLDELMEICDSVTVMRDGRVIDTVTVAETSQAGLARMMVGRDVTLPTRSREPAPGPVFLRLEGVGATNHKGLPALRQLSLEVRRGEIFGIAGVDGNGQEELAELLAGMRRPSTGRIRLGEGEISPGSGSRQSVGYIPADRRRVGLVGDFDIQENLVLTQYRLAPFSRWGLLNLRKIGERAAKLAQEYRVRGGGLHVAVRSLSGGNQQKVVLARELSGHPDLIIASQPTQGLDIGAAAFVEELLIEHRNRGAAVILISTELERVLALSDRVGVLFGGELMGIRQGDEIDREEIGLMMAGRRMNAGRGGEVAG